MILRVAFDSARRVAAMSKSEPNETTPRWSIRSSDQTSTRQHGDEPILPTSPRTAWIVQRARMCIGAPAGAATLPRYLGTD
jgi:hypothetical protein